MSTMTSMLLLDAQRKLYNLQRGKKKFNVKRTWLLREFNLLEFQIDISIVSVSNDLDEESCKRK